MQEKLGLPTSVKDDNNACKPLDGNPRHTLQVELSQRRGPAFQTSSNNCSGRRRRLRWAVYKNTGQPITDQCMVSMVYLAIYV